MSNINLPLPDEMLERIDRARKLPVGLASVPRVAWIRDAIELALRRSEQAEQLAGSDGARVTLGRVLSPLDLRPDPEQ